MSRFHQQQDDILRNFGSSSDNNVESIPVKYELIINHNSDMISLFLDGEVVEHINGMIPYIELHDLISDWVKRPILHEKSAKYGVYVYEVSYEI